MSDTLDELADRRLTVDRLVPPGRSRPPRPRRSAGERQRRRRAERRRRILRLGAAVVALAALAAATVWATTLVPAFDRGRSGMTSADDDAAASGGQRAVLFVTFDERDPTRGAALAFVLARDPRTDESTLLFIPTATVADIPGHGLDRIERAYSFGQGALVGSTVENLLGLDLDGVVEVSRQGWASLFGRAGRLTVEVSERLVATEPDGNRRVRFEPGRQPLDGPRLAELLTFQGEAESDLDRLPRVRRVLNTLLEALAAQPGILEAVFADGAPMLDTTVPADELQSLLQAAATAHVEDQLAVFTLPVSPIGSGGDGSLRVDRERAVQLVADRFADSIPVAQGSGGRRVQILNGNGEPGIGQQVAERLLPAGFRIVLTKNADRFDHDETRILVYEDRPEQLQLADQIRDLLGVGRVEISRTPQSVVDITIVVGRDFAGASG